MTEPAPSAFTIRTGSPADAAQLAAFARAVFEQTYGEAIPPGTLAHFLAHEIGDQRVAAELADPTQPHLLAWHGGALAGFSRMRQAEPPGELGLAAPIEISRFYVGRAWQGIGLAASLLGESLTYARRLGQRSAWLCVWQQNARALAFYRKHGFATRGHAIVRVDEIAFDDLVLACDLD